MDHASDASQRMDPVFAGKSHGLQQVTLQVDVGRSGQQEAFDPKANKIAIGYVHNLSKRTALYATLARVRNKNGANLTVGGPAFVTSLGGQAFTPKTSTGYDFGIRHAF